MSEPQKSPVNLSKTDARYWKARLFKRTTDDWQVQIAFAGGRQRFPLGTPNKDAAAAKARDIYLSLHRAGWDHTVADYKPWTVKVGRGSEFPTVGEFLQEVKTVADLKPVTFEIYARKFRRLVAGLFDIEGTKERFDYANGGSRRWREKVNAIRIADIKPEKIQSWKVEFLKKASGNPLKHKRALSTVASLIRAGKALFSKGVLQHLTLRLPAPLPFDGVKAGNTGNHRYKSEINPAILLQRAHRDLRQREPELFKVILLALGAGLRRDEIDTLIWKQIDWDRKTIRIETTIHTAAKTHSSEAEVDVDSDLLTLLRDHLTLSKSEFVINSPVAARPHAVSYHHYRCNRVFKRTNAWLHEQGISARTPLHALRKEFGSLICARAGIFAASVALRHSNISLTRDYYVEKKHPIALPIGDLLKSKSHGETTEFPSDAAGPASRAA
jgi:integrase